MTIALLNPSIASENTGDTIIIDAVMLELGDLFKDEHFVNIPTQDRIGAFSKAVAARANHRLVGGTNLLSSHMLKFKQWKINFLDTLQLNDVTLMGVGWWQYQGKPDIYTAAVLRRVLSGEALHSVRDEYTKQKLQSIGIDNVINTGCPTMWRLTPQHCAQIPTGKADSVVLTLTDYKASPSVDRKLIEVLKSFYKKVYFWPQGSGDLRYINELGVEGMEIIPATLTAYNSLLDGDGTIDFVGTRLHGGVRALQKFRRSLILAVDNRSIEISKDTGLPVIGREAYDKLEQWILGVEPTSINMDLTAIQQWKQQYMKK